jgi:SIR2-like domain
MADVEHGATAYRAEITSDIESCVSQMACQPILFVGSGLSKRYFSGPSWDELLTHLGKECPLIDKDYAYYKQTLKTQLAVGEEFAKLYQQWAWAKGKNQFPADMFSDAVPVQAYIKFIIAEYLGSITPGDLSAVRGDGIAAEIAALQGIRPHAIITTNYDRFLELAFPEYQPVIGQSIIREAPVLFGEIFKIHGCVSDYNSLVFTQ